MARENLQKTLRRERQADERQRQELDRLMAEHKARHAIYLYRAKIAGMLVGAGFVPADSAAEGAKE